MCLNLAVYRRITTTSHRISTEITQRAPRILGFFSSHNVYYVKITILLDKHSKACYTSIADSHRGFLEYQRGGSSGSPLRDTERILGVSCEVQSPYKLWYRGVCFLLCCVIYKCNNFPREYFSEAPPPKIYLTLFALPYILGV